MKGAYKADDEIIGDDLDGTTSSETDYGETDLESEPDNPQEPVAATFDEDDESVIDLTANFDDELKRHMPQQGLPARQNVKTAPPAKPEDHQNSQDKQSGMLWRNAGALVLFRENAQKAAATYLESQSVKLSSDRKRTKHIRDWSAYRAGQEDSKKIDVKRRRIEG